MSAPQAEPEPVETTNYAKFQTANPVVRRLIGHFYREVGALIKTLPASSVLDAGCGEGETLSRLGSDLPQSQAGVDLNPASVAFAAARLPAARIELGDVTDLAFADDQFDLVLCLEVLEHLADPGLGLRELARVARSDLIVSVPHEPWFRVGSFARGKYLKTWGNHPEHLNHWNPASLRRFLEAQVEVVAINGSMPWLIAHCRP